MIYIYKNESGTQHETVQTIAEMEGCRCEDGTYDVPGFGVCERDHSAELRGTTGGCSNWPMECEGSAVHPDQIPEAHEAAQARGVATSFTQDGNPIFTSARHRSKYLKAFGMFDRDAGYADPAPSNC